ncbi:MAG: DNA polymerase I [Clostridia bacterium]|nr:DNA polymerase I [Clostridia bacterium]
MKKLLIIDSNSLINRAYYGVRFLSAPDGTPTNAIYGFLMMLLKLISDHNPDYVMAAFDLKAPTFRHKMYDGYKAQRKPMPDDLVKQMPIAREIVDKMGILRLEKEGFEADDIIGTVSRLCGEKGIKCLIATGDKDDLQLADEFTSILLTTTKSGNTETEEYTPDKVFERYGVTPTEFIDVKALMGDQSDNIPGVSGIGEKTAMALIAKHKSIENIYDNFDSHGFKGAQLTKLSEGKESAYLSKKLATIDKNVPMDIDFDLAEGGIDGSSELLNILTKLGLNSIIKRMDFSNVKADAIEAENPIENAVKAVITSKEEFEALKEKIRKIGEASFVFGTENGKVVRMGIALGVEEGFLLDGREYVDGMADILSDKSINKLCFGVKDAIVALSPDIRLLGIGYDVVIAEYLINPSRSDYSADALAVQYFGASPIEHGEKQISLFDDDENPDDNIISEALLIKPLMDKTLQKLKAAEQEKLYFDVELPLVTVLADMQIEGMYVDREKLSEFGKMLGERIDRLTTKIYDLAGVEFNINSPKQLGEILFEKLDLSPKKKTKSGYSTGAEVLENLRDKHPIIDMVLEYRQYAKLKSTYCDGLTAVISEKTGRIHSVFNQTVTVTGRISSTEPNMQNIPTRTELGREIRKMFVAENGKIFVDADYSQIELRVLAAIANDTAMKNAFLSGADIHTETAAQVLKIPAESVTKEQRSSAKAVNFGIVYGISEFSLAKDLKISVKEAREYITGYLEHYSGVRDYMENIKEEARKNGYVKTLMNRVRYIPELKSSNYNMRMFGERVALNTPIQGTAADIIKLAMVRVHKRLADEGLKSKLILQVHDELIVEAVPSEEVKVRQILSEEMENAVQIGVPLVADMESGRSWYDCK